MTETQNNVPNRQDWVFGYCNDILTDKQALIRQEFTLQLQRTMKMFKWKNLPDTIPQKDLELILQLNGHATFTQVDGKYYVFKGGLGGVPNEYYLPTISIVANPYLKFNKTLKINEECVVIQNDFLYQGLTPLFNKYASLIAEIIISLRWAIINARVPYLIDADNDNTKQDAKDFMEKIIAGTDIEIIGHNSFFEGIKTYDYASKITHVTELIEALQYLKAHWFNDLGLEANYNMKRETLTSAELSIGEDTLVPQIDEMLTQRKLACEKINKMYGLNISVELDSSWKQLREEQKSAIKKEEAEIAKLESEGANNENTVKEDTGE